MCLFKDTEQLPCAMLCMLICLFLVFVEISAAPTTSILVKVHAVNVQPEIVEEKQKPVAKLDGSEIQGDIIATEEDDATNRNALKIGDKLLWPNGEVKFAIAPQLEQYADLIQGVIEEIQENTCVKFERIDPSSQKPSAFIYYFDAFDGTSGSRSGCNSPVGMSPMSDGPQGAVTINLDRPMSENEPSCMHHSVIMHETLHALGLAHEHMRADRDHYLNTFRSNVKPSRQFNFIKLDKEEATTYDVPYDYRSVMHYDKKAFSAAGEITMLPVDKTYEDIIGNVETASTGDWIKVNKMYECSPKYFKQAFYPDEPCINGEKCMGGSACSKEKLCKCPSEKPVVYKKKCIKELKNCQLKLPVNAVGGTYSTDGVTKLILNLTAKCDDGKTAVTSPCNYETGEYDPPLVCPKKAASETCTIPTSLNQDICRCSGAQIHFLGTAVHQLTLNCIDSSSHDIDCNSTTGDWDGELACPFVSQGK